MNDLRTAATQALEALVRASSYYDTYAEIAALEAALAEPVQEPVRGPVAGAATSVHDKVFSEVALSDAYQQGWNHAMLRRSLGPMCRRDKE